MPLSKVEQQQYLSHYLAGAYHFLLNDPETQQKIVDLAPDHVIHGTWDEMISQDVPIDISYTITRWCKRVHYNLFAYLKDAMPDFQAGPHKVLLSVDVWDKSPTLPPRIVVNFIYFVKPPIALTTNTSKWTYQYELVKPLSPNGVEISWPTPRPPVDTKRQIG